MGQSTREFARRHPGPSDIALLIEVSDATFPFDREVKGRLYARSGIENYGIIDIPHRRVIALQGPCGEEYKSVRIFGSGEVADFGVISLDAKDLFSAMQ